MGVFSEMDLERIEKERLAKQAEQNRTISDYEKSSLVGPYFRAIKDLLLSVKNIKIPFKELMLKNGNLRMFLPKEIAKNTETEELLKIDEINEHNTKVFQMLQYKRKLKMHDMPFIKSIYFNGFESDVWLEKITELFNNNRKSYPYLDYIFRNEKDVCPADLYMFAEKTMTRGFSQQRKDEKLAFQNAKAMLKRSKEQVSILFGKQTASAKKIMNTLRIRLGELNKLKEKAEEIDKMHPETMNSSELFKFYVRKNAQTLNVDPVKVWNIQNEQDLYLVAKNILLKDSELRFKKAEPKKNIKLESKAEKIANNQTTKKKDEFLETKIESKQNDNENKKTFTNPNFVKGPAVQMEFVLDGENVGDIKESTPKTRKNLGKEKE